MKNTNPVAHGLQLVKTVKTAQPNIYGNHTAFYVVIGTLLTSGNVVTPPASLKSFTAIPRTVINPKEVITATAYLTRSYSEPLYDSTHPMFKPLFLTATMQEITEEICIDAIRLIPTSLKVGSQKAKVNLVLARMYLKHVDDSNAPNSSFNPDFLYAMHSGDGCSLKLPDLGEPLTITAVNQAKARLVRNTRILENALDFIETPVLSQAFMSSDCRFDPDLFAKTNPFEHIADCLFHLIEYRCNKKRDKIKQEKIIEEASKRARIEPPKHTEPGQSFNIAMCDNFTPSDDISDIMPNDYTPMNPTPTTTGTESKENVSYLGVNPLVPVEEARRFNEELIKDGLPIPNQPFSSCLVPSGRGDDRRSELLSGTVIGTPSPESLVGNPSLSPAVTYDLPAEAVMQQVTPAADSESFTDREKVLLQIMDDYESTLLRMRSAIDNVLFDLCREQKKGKIDHSEKIRTLSMLQHDCITVIAKGNGQLI